MALSHNLVVREGGFATQPSLPAYLARRGQAEPSLSQPIHMIIRSPPHQQELDTYNTKHATH